MILNREREASSKADIYLDRKDAMPAAAAGCGLGGQLGKERSPWVDRERIEKKAEYAINVIFGNWLRADIVFESDAPERKLVDSALGAIDARETKYTKEGRLNLAGLEER
jgi:hypothetical protein